MPRYFYPTAALAALALLTAPIEPFTAIAASDRPQVISVLAVVDEETGTLERFAEMTGELNKALPTEDERCYGDVLWSSDPPNDAGWIEIRSRLTGQVLVHASVVWMGTGSIVEPAPEAFRTDWRQAPGNPEPFSFRVLRGDGGSEPRAQELWAKVRDTDFVARVSAAPGSYEVVAVRHDYGEGGAPPDTDWYFLIFSRPKAPNDLSLLQAMWPRGYTPSGSDLVPEVRLHNFSDVPLSLDVRAQVDLPEGGSELRIARVDTLQPDHSIAVRTDPVHIDGRGAGRVSWQITGPSGEGWRDLDPANDQLEVGFEAVAAPVFRSVSSIRHPGPIPNRGTALDFDDDGDADLLTHEYQPRIWRNDGAAGFTDISAESPALPHYPRDYLAADFDGDQKLDVVVVTWAEPVVYLRGDGSGKFQDLTANVGLGGVRGLDQAVIGDLDNDGDQDLIVPSSPRDRVFRNDAGHFVDETSTSQVGDAPKTLSATLGDIDADGLLDIVLANWDGESSVYHNLGGWRFERVAGPFAPEVQREAAVLDYDRDGHPDIFFTGAYDLPWMFRGLGGLRFERVPPEELALPKAFGVSARDVDGDGGTDLLLETLDRFYLLLNDHGRFVEHTELIADMSDHFRFGALGRSPDVQWIDFDGDGDIDMTSEMGTFFDVTRGTFPAYVTWTNDPSEIPPEILPMPVPSPIVIGPPCPSPFASTTHVSLRSDEQQRLTLDVLDVAGRRIARIFNGAVGVTPIDVEWDGRAGDGRRVPAGIYYLRAAGESKTTTRSVVLVK